MSIKKIGRLFFINRIKSNKKLNKAPRDMALKINKERQGCGLVRTVLQPFSIRPIILRICPSFFIFLYIFYLTTN